MSEEAVENGHNIVAEKTSLINYLINYLMKIRREDLRGRVNLTTRISPNVYHDFDYVCRRLGLISHGRINVALEGLMQFFIEQYKEHPTVIQQTLTNVFIKAEPQSQVTVNLSQRLEVKLIKRDLAYVIQGLESRKGNQPFFIERLHDILPKALRVYEKTMDPELEQLLKQSENWI